MSDLVRRLMVTGGAGFIGSNFARLVLAGDGLEKLVVLDKLTYAGNLANLEDLRADPRFAFVQGDIADGTLVDELASDVQAIINFAAESHVDRSIEAPEAFITTDVYGTYVLLEAARRHGHARFLQVSTDEVYGHVPTGSSRESDPLSPRSPYSASKAGADLLAMAYHVTHGLPVVVTRGANTYGPYQYPEKLIPLFITNAIDDEPLPLYGDGLQQRDWIHVDDHCAAIDLVFRLGEAGSAYNVGAGNHATNIDLTGRLLALLERPASLVRHVADRPGHDRRYALDTSRLTALGWQPQVTLDDGLAATVRWYQQHEAWWRPLKSGEYLEYYRRQYGDRLAAGTVGA